MMKVISVDVAPGKPSTVFDGCEFKDLDAHALRDYLKEHEKPGTLVCWDAPLTGPRNPDDAGLPRDFTQRPIDGFFGSTQGRKTPKGISVLGYGGCPHWTITRSLIGLPRLGPFDAPYWELPFYLWPGAPSESDQHPPVDERPTVVEIHPGLAAWLWCCEESRKWKDPKVARIYKGKNGRKLREEMWEIILSKASGLWDYGCAPTETDDQFDAAVGYILGRALLEGENGTVRVASLGDRRMGSFLLPVVPGLESAWKQWIAKCEVRNAYGV